MDIRLRRTFLSSIESFLEGTLTVSPDNRSVAFVQAKSSFMGIRTRYVVVSNGKSSAEYENVAKIISFSADHSRLGFYAQRGGKWFAVVDEREGQPFDDVGAGGVIFSPDGKRFAYSAVRNGSWFVVVDGAESPPYQNTSPK